MEDFKPRDYQVQLMEIGLKKNTVIYLPTGSGKTFVALMILKRMSGDLLKPYSEGGKLSIILVNTISLVSQHAKYIIDHTNLKVGQYSGDMKLDFWPREKWYKEYDKYQVLIMTSQILVNNVTSNYMDLNKINLIIFDECHRGVSDHSMRQLMKGFQGLVEPPRVIGLTASLLNGNCKPGKVLDQLMTLEVTFHGKVATVDGLSVVIGYSTNPQELLRTFTIHTPTKVEVMVVDILKSVISFISCFKFDNPANEQSLDLEGHTLLGNLKVTKRKLTNLVQSAITHIETMGTFGGLQTAIAYIIQLERLKRKFLDQNQLCLLHYIETKFIFVKQLLENAVLKYPEKERAFKCSSDKIVKLLGIFDEYKWKSKEELCGIIFTQQRITAKILYFVLDSLSKTNPKYSYVTPDYIVGIDNNPHNSTREDMYSLKKNKQVLNRFKDKEINLIIASNVLEEGVDIPTCTLVVKYDHLTDYRSYIQSKGRARHKNSLYYMLVQSDKSEVYMGKYNEYLKVETIINDYLVGMNEVRQEPSAEDIEKMYHEYELEPYYATGPGSAHITMATAIPLLTQYCLNLPSDIYTIYTPEWYEKNEKKMIKERSCTSVTIMLPTVCPLTDPIEGEYMPNIKTAKRAVAMKACRMLHEIGELDDHLLPKKNKIPEEDISFLFEHYPEVKEPLAGSSKTKRLHKKQVSKYLAGSVVSNTYYLHVIRLQPVFSKPVELSDLTMYDSVTSELCFGVLTLNPLPPLSKFPLYDTLGALNVELEVNKDKIFLDDSELVLVKKFHHRIFKDILKIKSLLFLVMDNSTTAEVLLLVPVHNSKIDVDALTVEVEKVDKPSPEENVLEVTQKSHSMKIVCPWYRPTAPYVVTKVVEDITSLSPFPNENFNSYAEYFQKTYKLVLTSPGLPLLLLKSLTKRLNFVKSKGKGTKRKRDQRYEDTSIHLPAELVVKQNFPSCLWIQAKFLPTVLSRISFMLQIEELRVKIAGECGLGEVNMQQPPLILDNSLLNYKVFIEEPPVDLQIEINPETPPPLLQTNKALTDKLLEAEFPWKNSEEPKDIERTLDVNINDIEKYERFICKRIDSEKVLLKNENAGTSESLVCTDERVFVEKPLQVLKSPFTKPGPSIAALYRALTTANSNDIVNLERLETLGDSFLKWVASFYVYVRFPKYDEGKYTTLKSRLVSNKHLYYLAEKQNLGGIMKYEELSPENQWLPPGYTVPKELLKKIENKELPVTVLSSLSMDTEEQVSGMLKSDTVKKIVESFQPLDKTEVDSFGSKDSFLKYQFIGDKHVADVVESLLGAYLLYCGLLGAVRFVEWIGIIPKSENLEELIAKASPNPVLNAKSTLDDIKCHLPQWKDVENILGYNFKNHAYLLQALTHSSYSLNRITLSYEKLEFIGDAILDFLITCYIYESCGNLNPGELTDLRSALVNNNTFASLVIRSGLHKHLLMMNFKLQNSIDRFNEFMKAKNYQIDDEVLILLDEDELHLAEYVEVPKVLGDLFEALIGAIFLDCGKDFKTVWNVIYRMMWKEMDLFSRNVPINVIRKIFETPDVEPKFGNAVTTSNGKSIVVLRFLKDGKPKFVHGCGTNKSVAKRAAAKLALRELKV